MWGYYLLGGEYGAVDFHVLCHDPLKCDSSGRRGVVHKRSIPTPHTNPCFAGEGEVSDQQSIHILSRSCRLSSPVLLQLRLNELSQPSESPLIPYWFLPCGDSLVDESPCLHQYPRVVMRQPFVRLRNSAPQLIKYFDCLRPRLTDGHM